MQIFFNKVSALDVDPHTTVCEVKSQIEGKSGIPACHQRLIYAGRQLEDASTLAHCRVGHGSTLHLVLRLRGGKGGFGALLRGAGRAALTDNFDACRDLSGRRLRHVNADAKLAEWAAGARERELEKLGLKHIREAEKASAREAAQQVDMEAVRHAQEAALASVMDAMHSALADRKGKRPADAPAAAAEAAAPAEEAGDAAAPARKRARRAAPAKKLFGMSEAPSSESEGEDDEDDGDDVAALLARPARACKSASDSCLAVATGASGRPGGSSDESDQEALPAPVAAAPPPSMQASALEEAVGSAPQAPDQEAASVQSAPLSVAASVPSPVPNLAPAAVGASIVDSSLGPADLATVGSTAGTLAPAGACGAKSGADSSLPARKDSTAGVNSASAAAAAAEPIQDDAPLDLALYGTAVELEAVGLDRLKRELQAKGLKCGGSLADRAARLFLLRDTPLEKIERKHLAKPGAAKKAS